MNPEKFNLLCRLSIFLRNLLIDLHVSMDVHITISIFFICHLLDSSKICFIRHLSIDLFSFLCIINHIAFCIKFSLILKRDVIKFIIHSRKKINTVSNNRNRCFHRIRKNKYHRTLLRRISLR